MQTFDSHDCYTFITDFTGFFQTCRRIQMFLFNHNAILIQFHVIYSQFSETFNSKTGWPFLHKVSVLTLLQTTGKWPTQFTTCTSASPGFRLTPLALVIMYTLCITFLVHYVPLFHLNMHQHCNLWHISHLSRENIQYFCTFTNYIHKIMLCHSNIYTHQYTRLM